MQQPHRDRIIYFQEQAECTQRYVIPYIEQVLPVTPNLRILEIGCGEGGNLKPFLKLGCQCVGVDIDVAQLEKAKQYLSEYYQGDNLTLIARNIYDVQPDEIGTFDIIMLRNVIEHIPNQKQFMHYLKDFMHNDTVVFFGFPIWCNPFGGHHQICPNKWLSHTPWLHLLPNGLYSKMLKLGGETESKIQALLDIKETGISLYRFEGILYKEQYQVLCHTHYLINPNYEIKFGLRPWFAPLCCAQVATNSLFAGFLYYGNV